MTNPTFEFFEEQVFFTTLRIERPELNSMGTGFLVEIPACVSGHKYIFLVTNRHVFDKQKAQTNIDLHLKDENGNPLIGEVFKLSITEFENGYFTPDDDETDLALINLSEVSELVNKKTNKQLNIRCIDMGTFSDYTEPDLLPNTRVAFIGYPHNLYDKKNYLPIFRSGIIASIPRIDYEGRAEVLVDAQVFPGSSGSPVFANLQNKWKFLGVIYQTILTKKSLEIITTSQQVISEGILGIGMMIKAKKVKELVEKAKTELDKINCPKTKTT